MPASTATQTGPNVIAAQRTIWNGEPGTVWTNDTGKVKYQFICTFTNTCGFCLQYHLAIGGIWGIPLHHGCNCEQKKIPPDAQAPHAFVDFRELLEDMPHAEQVACIGAANYKLLKSGDAEWSDIVTPMRVRDLREVVAIKKLSVDQMLRAGINPKIAERAWSTVNTPEHMLIERHRRELMEKIKAAGLNHEELVRQLSQRLAERVTVAAGPIATGTTTPSWGPSSIQTGHAAELAALLKAWRPAAKAPPQPAPGQKEFHQEVAAAIEDVPPERLIGEKAWIHDVWAAHQANPANRRLTLDEFKQLLLTDENRGKLRLGRADLAHRMNRADVAASEVQYRIGDRITATFNFIRPKK